MPGYWFLGVLAAFGAFCMAFALAGLLLPGWLGSVLVYPCRNGAVPQSILLCYRWLRGMGMVKAPLILLDAAAHQQENLQARYPYLEFCSLADLSARLERERNNGDGNGNGDSPGHHPSGGVPQL